MPTIIPLGKWDFTAPHLQTLPQESVEPEVDFTTEDVLESLEKLFKRPEIDELDELIQNSAMYIPGKPHAEDR